MVRHTGNRIDGETQRGWKEWENTKGIQCMEKHKGNGMDGESHKGNTMDGERQRELNGWGNTKGIEWTTKGIQ